MVTIQFSAPAIGGKDLLCSYTYTYTEVSNKCEASRHLHQQAKQDLHLENGMSWSHLRPRMAGLRSATRNGQDVPIYDHQLQRYALPCLVYQIAVKMTDG